MNGGEHGGRGKGGGLNFVTRYAFRVLVSHTHGRWCLNDERSLWHFALLFRQRATFDGLWHHFFDASSLFSTLLTF